MHVSVTEFGKLPEGEVALLYCVENANGMIFKVSNYGGIVTNISVPDRNGCLLNVCLGFDSLEDYLNDESYCGALIGRYANRIKHGKFELDGNSFELYQNDLPHHLHGGRQGFNKKIWNSEIVHGNGKIGIKLTYLSRDGDEGYPGNCYVTATYELNNKNEILLLLEAECDKATPINLTQHSYFNLSGLKNVLNHHVKIDSNVYVPVNESQLPIGVTSAVADTPFDFRSRTLLSDIDFEGHIQTSVARGFNHYFILSGSNAEEINFAAELMDSKSGRTLEVFTSAPGIQFYTGGFLSETDIDGNNIYGPHSGISFEPQYCPDSINQAIFPSTVLRPGQLYSSKTLYKFSVSSGVVDEKIEGRFIEAAS